MRSGSDEGEPMMATKIATPTASAACRIMLMTPEPVANAEDGRPAEPTPIMVGEVRPTPMPVGIMPATTSHGFGSPPITVAQITRPAAKNRMPAVPTIAGPKRLIRRPATSSEVIGTSSGPGAMQRPVCSADHPHALCSHNATDNSMAPKAAEYGASTRVAPVKDRILNSAGSTNGLGERKQRQTNNASRMIAAAALPAMPGEPQPQSLTLTMANVSAPMPPVTKAASPALGR